MGNALFENARAVKKDTSDGKLMFTVNSIGKFSSESEYCTAYTQKMLDLIK